jgi:DNA-binding response OmpR family regulator
VNRRPDTVAKVLLVEDSPLAARAAWRSLRKAGFRVTLATSVTEAEGRTGRYDIGVFDVDLGDGDGIELARRLLSTGKVRCAVFHSASCEAETRRRAGELGAYVGKSADPSELLETIARAAANLSS